MRRPLHSAVASSCLLVPAPGTALLPRNTDRSLCSRFAGGVLVDTPPLQPTLPQRTLHSDGDELMLSAAELAAAPVAAAALNGHFAGAAAAVGGSPRVAPKQWAVPSGSLLPSSPSLAARNAPAAPAAAAAPATPASPAKAEIPAPAAAQPATALAVMNPSATLPAAPVGQPALKVEQQPQPPQQSQLALQQQQQQLLAAAQSPALAGLAAQHLAQQQLLLLQSAELAALQMPAAAVPSLPSAAFASAAAASPASGPLPLPSGVVASSPALAGLSASSVPLSPAQSPLLTGAGAGSSGGGLNGSAESRKRKKRSSGGSSTDDAVCTPFAQLVAGQHVHPSRACILLADFVRDPWRAARLHRLLPLARSLRQRARRERRRRGPHPQGWHLSVDSLHGRRLLGCLPLAAWLCGVWRAACAASPALCRSASVRLSRVVHARSPHSLLSFAIAQSELVPSIPAMFHRIIATLQAVERETRSRVRKRQPHWPRSAFVADPLSCWSARTASVWSA